MNPDDLALLAAAFGVIEWEPNYVGRKAFLADGNICIKAHSDGQRWSDVEIETVDAEETTLIEHESVTVRCNTRQWTGRDTDRWLVSVYSNDLKRCGPILARALCFLGCEDPILDAPFSSISELPQVTEHEKLELGLQGREYRNST
jgi:hypothetical protein